MRTYASDTYVKLNFGLYSYDAAEDNELSFRAGDRIIEIEAASEDWWQGKDKDGLVGLFPGEPFTRILIRSITS